MKTARVSARSLLSRIDPLRFNVPGVGAVVFNYAESFSLTKDRLSDNMAEHSENYAFWRYALSRLRESLREYESELNECESRVYLQERDKFLSELPKGMQQYPSDQFLRARVSSNQTIRALRAEVLRIRSDVELAQAITESLDDRRSALINLGADARKRQRLSIRD